MRRYNNLTQAQRERTGSSGPPGSSTASVRYLLQRIRQSEARIRLLEEAAGLDVRASGPAVSRKPDELRWAEDDKGAGSEEEGDQEGWGSQNGAGGEGGEEAASDGARYQLTMDEGGNVGLSLGGCSAF